MICNILEKTVKSSTLFMLNILKYQFDEIRLHRRTKSGGISGLNSLPTSAFAAALIDIS